MTENTKKNIRMQAEKLLSYTAKRKSALIFGTLVFLFGSLRVGSLFPFGFALYIAGDKHHGAGLWGLELALLVGGAPPLSFAIGLGLYSFKKLTEGHLKGTQIKPLTALTAAAFLWASADRAVYSLARNAAVLIILPLFTLLYSFMTADKRIKPTLRHGSYGAFLFTAILLVYRLFGAEAIPAALALFCTFVAAFGGGMLYGGFYGLVCGLGCGSGVGALCGVTGLVAGLFSAGGKLCSYACGCFAGVCVGLYFFGGKGMLWLTLAYIAAGIALWGLSKRIELLPRADIALGSMPVADPTAPFAEAFFAISQGASHLAVNETEAARTADPYANLSTLLANAAAEEETERCHHKALSTQAANLLYSAGIKAERAYVIGGRRKTLVAEGVELDRLNISTDQLKKLVSATLGVPMREPKFFPVGSKARLVMESAPLFKIECTRKGCPKRGEELCGDTVSFFSNENGLFYALISDGMGSGKAAADCSHLTCLFLEKLLSAGADRKTALSMLNSFLASREGEVFATVDLFEADLYTGKGVLTKAGAAPSFIIRDGKCNTLQSPTLPAGIIRKINAAGLHFDLKHGDTLIMLSDGIAEDDGEDTTALISAVAEEKSTAALADRLLKDSIKSRECKDDMSVCVIKILAA